MESALIFSLRDLLKAWIIFSSSYGEGTAKIKLCVLF